MEATAQKLNEKRNGLIFITYVALAVAFVVYFSPVV